MVNANALQPYLQNQYASCHVILILINSDTLPLHPVSAAASAVCVIQSWEGKTSSENSPGPFPEAPVVLIRNQPNFTGTHLCDGAASHYTLMRSSGEAGGG